MNDVSGIRNAIEHLLLEWFAEHRRSYPWRNTTDPYAILVAEKLLQQTSVRDDVVAAFTTLLLNYPSITSLAHADIDQVRDIVEPLGLHYRAGELVATADFVEKNFGGHIPQTLKDLLTIPGIGDYIARAILCFAFGTEFAIVDVNVGRVLYRLFDIKEKFPSNPARKRSLLDLATALLPNGKARDFNLAIIDLGALVCKSIRPKCKECPLVSVCAYAITQQENVSC